MTLAARIEALEARIGPRAKRCVIFTMKCPDPERYEQVIADRPCARDRASRAGTLCVHRAQWRLKPGLTESAQ